MTTIYVETFIPADVETTFDLARSVEAHLRSTSKTGESVTEGRASGLFELGDSVTWRARHFGLWFNLTVRITEMDRPSHFVDEMVKGPFKSMRHVHRFKEAGEGTVMTDEFSFELPFWVPGQIVAAFVVRPYLKRFLERRNQTLVELARQPLRH